METFIKLLQDPATTNIAAATADSVGPINTLKILGSAAIGGQQLLKETTKLLFTQDNESIGIFAGYAIGEAGTGQVLELTQTGFEYPQSLFALQGIYNEGIRPSSGNQIAIKIFEMKGIEDNAQIGISYEVNHGTAIANGRVWLTLGFKNIKAETTGEIVSAIKPLGGAFDSTFSLEMDTIQVDDTTMVMGPTDGFGGVTPVFEIKTNEGNIKSVQFIPFFTDTLSSGPIEAPHIISRHLRTKRALNEDKTEAPAEDLLPPITELSKKVEAATGMKMAKSPNGEYDILAGDKEEKYKLYPEEDGKFDTLAWTIDGETVEFQNLVDDIVQKPADAEGNQVAWIQGFSVSKDSKTGEIKWGLVAESYRNETGTVRENLPNFHEEENYLNYMRAVEEQFPPEKLFKKEIIGEMTGDYEIGAEGSKQGFRFESFFPSSDKGQLLFGYHCDSSYNGAGNDRLPVDALTGRYSPIQFSPVGSACLITEEGWGMIKCPIYMKETDNIIRVFGVEDEISGSGTDINKIYKELSPSDEILLVQYADSQRNAEKIQNETIVSPAVSKRMGVWYSKHHKKINFKQSEIGDNDIRVFANLLSKDYFKIKGPLTYLQNQDFLIFSFNTKIDR